MLAYVSDDVFLLKLSSWLVDKIVTYSLIRRKVAQST